MSMIEVTSMLDSLGSTLSKATVKTFFERNGKDSNEHELSIDEMIQCLEKEVSRPRSERKSINLDEPVMESGINTPTIQPEGSGVGSAAPSPRFDKLDFSGPAMPSQPGAGAGVGSSQEQREIYRDQVHLRRPSLPPAYITEPSQQPVLNVPPTPENLSPALRPQNLPSPHRHPRREYSGSSSDQEGDVSSGNGSQSTPDDVERVINVKTCPLCHRPRLNSKAEMDIVTHIAVCASQDWNRVDRIVVGNFVTPSQAQRKWLMKVISKVSSGAYQLGAVSALLMG
jgi:phosphatidylserine decarboxylase